MYTTNAIDVVDTETPLANDAAKIFAENETLIKKTISFYAPRHFDVDDLYQDLFISFTEKPIPPHIKNIKGYLRRAIKNDILDHIRRSRSYCELIRKYSEKVPLFSREPNPYGASWRSELSDKIFEIAQKNIPHHEFMALKQQFRDDNTFAQGSVNLNVSRRSFSRYLCMGIKNLKEAVRERDFSSDVNF